MRIRHFKLQPRSKRELRSFGLLRNGWWLFFTDVSGQPIGTIPKGQDKDGKDGLSRNFGKELPLHKA